jgi:hypothetical protein
MLEVESSIIMRPVPTVNNALPNQIAGPFLPIFETRNPEMMETLEDPRTKGSVLNTKGEQPRNQKTEENRHLIPAPVAEEPSTEETSDPKFTHNKSEKKTLVKQGKVTDIRISMIRCTSIRVGLCSLCHWNENGTMEECSCQETTSCTCLRSYVKTV